jgi:hypothetical protein
MVDTSRIHRLVARARRRLKFQSALDAATLALIPAAALAMVTVYLVRMGEIGESTAILLLCGAAGVVVAGGLVGALRRYPTHLVANRIDRASGLADRLANACDFEVRLARADDAPETAAMMRAAIDDAVGRLPRANVKAATPFGWPRETRPALAFAAVCALVAGLYFPDEAKLGTPGGPGVALEGPGGPPETAVHFDDYDLEYQRDLVDNLRQTAGETGDTHLEEFSREIDALLDRAERGEMTRQELLEALAKAEKNYLEGIDDNVEETLEELARTGRELSKNRETRDLGRALAQGDLEKAQAEMERLADKLEQGELSEREREQVARALEQAAEKFEQREQKREQQREQRENQIAERKQQLRRLKEQMEQAETEKERQELARRQKREERELQKLQREQQEQEQQERSASRRELKELHRNMQQASEQMRDQNERNRQQASRTMRDMRRNTGQIDQDQRRVANQRRVASQMSDLKEAMRRARQRGQGQQDRFGQNRRQDDFRRRARGGQGRRDAWRPGQGGQQGRVGQGQGQQGQGNQPGQGGQQGGTSWGTEDDHDPLGDPTRRSGQTVDRDVQGVQGRQGTSLRETILSAAEKGFATKAYQDVYVRYQKVVEEVINAEKVPSGYKYYVKKYFQKIKPHSM